MPTSTSGRTLAPAEIGDRVRAQFGDDVTAVEDQFGHAVITVTPSRYRELAQFLRDEPDIACDYFDFTAGVDLGDDGFEVITHLYSTTRGTNVRLKVRCDRENPVCPTLSDIYAGANWGERETWELFGINFEGHPHLIRILMPRSWQGHPLRKDHPARATEMDPFRLPEEKLDAEQEALRFRPEEWGMARGREDTDFLFLNVGPQHPGTHGVLRIVLELDGEEIVNAVPDIGFHHRGAEKMGERQTWHTYIPYTDRIDYLGGVMNNLAYLTAFEKLAGITVPPRGQMIRVMLAGLH